MKPFSKFTKGRSTLNEDILNNNLNDQIEYDQFFRAFGYSDDDPIFLRGFDDKKRTQDAQNWQVELWNFKAIIPTLKTANDAEWGIFFIVNGGGQKDEFVKIARAQFVDFDDDPFDVQIRKLNDFPFEPSIIVRTRKSLHCYWLLQDGNIKYFRELQERLIQFFGTDPVIKNESRVMRIPGFYHHKTDESVLIRLIKFDPDLKYTQEQLNEVLPKLTKTETSRSTPATVVQSDERVPQGQGHYYVVKKIGEILDRVGNTVDDQAILALVETDFLSKYDGKIDSIEAFRKKYIQTIAKLRARHDAEDKDPGFYSYAMKAWKAENPGRTFNKEETSWSEVRQAGERAKDAGKTFGDDQTINQNGSSSDPAPDPGKSSSQGDRESLKVINVSNYLSENLFEGDIEYFKKYQNRKIGFDNLDKHLTLYPGVACLGGASSLGKTTFAVNIVDNLLKKGESVIYFALEQLPIELITKSLARRMYEIDPASKITNVDIKNGASSDALVKAKKEYVQTARNYQVVEGDFHFTAQMIVNHVEKYIKTTGIKPIVVIDYLQLISPPDGFKGTQREITDENLKAIKDLSKRNELFILLISSFNRASYKEPVGMESFKESGMIEYTCDYIFGLQLSILEDKDFFTTTGTKGGERENNNAKKEEALYKAINQNPKEVEFVCLKNRNGKQRFKGFFKYWMEFDLFVQDLQSPHDPDSAYAMFKDVNDDDLQFEDV